jgi:hypothetical protein
VKGGEALRFRQIGRGEMRRKKLPRHSSRLQAQLCTLPIRLRTTVRSLQCQSSLHAKTRHDNAEITPDIAK